MDLPSAPSDGSERVVPILNFPLEITKMILVLILKPGTVYPQIGHQYDSSSDAVAKVSPPGFQILATCKPIYNIGFPIFYGENEFYLPRGPKENAEWYFSSLAIGHRSLIRRMVVKYSITDIDGSMLQENGLDRGSEDNGPSRHEASALALRKSCAAISVEAAKLWTSKLRWVCGWHIDKVNAGNPGLLHLKLELGIGHETIVIAGSELPTMSGPYGSLTIPPRRLLAVRGTHGYLQIILALLEKQRFKDRRSGTDGMEKWLEELRRAEDIERLA